MGTTYKGDTELNKLLKDAGSDKTASDIRDLLAGVQAAPADIADPDRWIALAAGSNDNEELREQLKALQSTIKRVPDDGQGADEQAVTARVHDIRDELKKQGVNGFIVPRADEFQGEYVPARAERLAWATGFTGSAGSAVILDEKAGFFTDGRYTLQARAQVPAAVYDICSISKNQDPTPTISPTEWVEQNLPRGAKLGFDPWLHTANQVKGFEEAAQKAGGTLVPVDTNPLDAAWTDQPAAPISPVVEHPMAYAGKSSADKRAELGATLKQKNADAFAVTLPEDVAWLLNIRGGDVPCTPLPLSFAIAHDDGTVDLYIDRRKLSPGLEQTLGSDVRIHDLEEFQNGLETLGKAGKTVLLDPDKSPVGAQYVIEDAGGTVQHGTDPIQLPKAQKNATEVQGTIDAHIRDGVALTRFLARLGEQGAAAKYSEIGAADLLQSYREENEKFRGLSFDTISGAGGNGAIIHYRVTEKTDAPLTAGPVYLVDSGAQYLDGTTDVTRTVAMDNVTDEMKENFTRVLKGHIQVAKTIFPEGTDGIGLDEKARKALQDVGLDFAHGTGHGVGSYLSVHEGPCGIHPRAKTPLEPGMIVSNEPGFYKEGEYGIRIESLVVVEDTGKTDDDGKKLYGFRTLTMAPIDPNLIEPSLLDDDELEWLNEYHEKVRNTLLPELQKKDPDAADWLKEVTKPLKKPDAAPADTNDRRAASKKNADKKFG